MRHGSTVGKKLLQPGLWMQPLMIRLGIRPSSCESSWIQMHRATTMRDECKEIDIAFKPNAFWHIDHRR
eukprot:828516-Amphidinium_carterae.1